MISGLIEFLSMLKILTGTVWFCAVAQKSVAVMTSKEMVKENRDEIVRALTEFKNNDFAKVYDKWHFYYNKQSIMLTNVDENGNSFESHLPTKINRDGEEVRAKSKKLKPLKITQAVDDERFEITEFEIDSFDATKYPSLQHYFDEYIKPGIAALDYKEADLKVHEKNAWMLRSLLEE